jgi:hypothetical protein
MLGLIRHNTSKGETGSIINGDMDIFPSSAFDQIPPVAGDAVTEALDAGELFDVEMDELAWPLTFIAACGCRGIDQGQTMQAMTTKQTRDSRLGQSALASDLEAWQTQPAQTQDHGDLRLGRLFWTAKRSRGAIAQSFWSLGSIAGQPLAGRAFAQGKGRRDVLCPDPFVDNGKDKCFSTTQGQSSISMDVHALGLGCWLV